MKIKALSITFLLLCFLAGSQTKILQGTIKGGVSADGVGYWFYDHLQDDTIKLVAKIPSGSYLKKAWLLTTKIIYQVGKPNGRDFNTEIKLNDSLIRIDSTEIVAGPIIINAFFQPEGYLWFTMQDVTPYVKLDSNILVTPNQASLMLQDPKRNVNELDYCLLIAYENPAFKTCNYTVFINDIRNTDPITFNLNGINPINNTKDVGLSFHGSHICSWPWNITSSYQLQSSLGLFNLGTLDMYDGANGYYKSLTGSFQYRNDSLLGQVDDSADSLFNGTDALTNIKSYIANNTTNFQINSQGYIAPSSGNIRTLWTLAYTSPCSTAVEVPDTVFHICRGQQAQIQLPQGYGYSWYPKAGLNDSTIPNPIASPFNSTFYTCLITDSMGCKWTTHAKVVVHPPPAPDTSVFVNAICGTQDGSIYIKPPFRNFGPYSFSIGGPAQNDTAFTNLTPGAYTLTVSDNRGCSYSQSFSITQSNPVNALFGVFPAQGIYPLTVITNNASTGTNQYVWYTGLDTLSGLNPMVVYNSPGTYTLTLVAYNNLSQCADTFSVQVIVLDSTRLSFTIPNIFSPNNDGINDAWGFSFVGDISLLQEFELNIFNRWGILVYSSSNPQQQWDGRSTSGMSCEDGVYYYTAKLKRQKKKQETFEGFLHLIR